jgi:hypothetical protein
MRGFTGRRIRLSTRSAATVATGVLLLSALFAPATLAASPNEGTATVDGATGDWSLGADFFADMTDAGHPDAAVRAKLYLKYDCESETLFALVLAQGEEQVRQERTDEAYIMIDGTKVIDSTHGDFAWVNGDGELADGFEGGAELAAGSYTLRAHVLVADDSADGYTPMDVIGRTVPLDIECQEVEPTATAKPPTPKPTDNGGGVEPTTGTNQGPTKTLPPTDTLDPAGSASSGAGLILTILAVGSLATLVVTLGGRRRSMARVEVKETTKRR